LESSKSTSNTEQTPSSQIAFNDRVSAAQILANVLENTVKKITNNKDEVLVLGIPRGGAIVADIVASKLDYDFDVVFPRKMLSTGNKVNTIGAVMSDGTTYFDESLIESLKIPQGYIKKENSYNFKRLVCEKSFIDQINHQKIMAYKTKSSY
jgi:predicted phosphoribosyltransferase